MMSDEPIRIEELRHRARLHAARKTQFEIGREGMSDYQITGGAALDAVLRGVSVMDLHDAFMESETALEFEAKLWAAPSIHERWPPEKDASE
jgi:hypothetical protein